MVPTLPQEVMGEIVSHLYLDTLSLRSCTLVSHVLLRLTRRYLFHTISLQADDAVEYIWRRNTSSLQHKLGALREVLTSRPALCAFVRRIELLASCDEYEWLYEKEGCFLAVMKLLHPIRNLTLQLDCLPPGEAFMALPELGDFVANFWKPYVAPCVSNLIIGNLNLFSVDLIFQCQNLRSLTAERGSFWNHFPTQPDYRPHIDNTYPPPGVTHSPVHLNKLTIFNQGQFNDIMTFIQERPREQMFPLASLTSFSLGFIRAPDIDTAEYVLSRAAQNLEDLSLIFEPHDYAIDEFAMVLRRLRESKIVLLSQLPSLRHLSLMVNDLSDHRRDNSIDPFIGAATFIQTASSSSSIEIVDIKISMAYPSSTSFEDWSKWLTRDWSFFDQVLYGFAEALQRRISFNLMVEIQKDQVFTTTSSDRDSESEEDDGSESEGEGGLTEDDELEGAVSPTDATELRTCEYRGMEVPLDHRGLRRKWRREHRQEIGQFLEDNFTLTRNSPFVMWSCSYIVH